MKNESFVKMAGEYTYVCHNEIKPDTRTLLFVHGLGDSGLRFGEVFDDPRFVDFNLVVPDLVGYGRSSASSREDGYSFRAHLERLWEVVRWSRAPEVILIGHSMGGDLTTLMCASDTDGIIRKYVNVEGDVTQHDLFISGKVVEADRRGEFDRWFREELMHRKIYEEAGHQRSSRSYFASLCFARPDAFLENARELVERNTALPGSYQSEIGEIYRSLSIPRVFCYGTGSLSDGSLAFLKEKELERRAFQRSGHCPMNDEADEFYDFLYRFVTSRD